MFPGYVTIDGETGEDLSFSSKKRFNTGKYSDSLMGFNNPSKSSI